MFVSPDPGLVVFLSKPRPSSDTVNESKPCHPEPPRLKGPEAWGEAPDAGVRAKSRSPIGVEEGAGDGVGGSSGHHHGDYQTFAYVVSGRARIEFGPAGAQTAEAGPGDFLHIPSHIVHRESNPAEEEQQVVLFRVGTGTSLINVDGPSAE